MWLIASIIWGMSLQPRPLRIGDLQQCLELAAEPVLNLAPSPQRALQRFEYLLRRNSLIGVSVCEGSTVLGFATVIAISDQLLERVIAPTSPGFLRMLFTDNGISEQFLAVDQLELAHHRDNPNAPFSESMRSRALCADGINFMSAFSGWKNDDTAVKDELAKSIGTYLAGHNVGSYHKELYSQKLFDEFSRFFGLPYKRSAEGRILAGMTRAEWHMLRNPGQPINQILGARIPTIYLTEAERRVVQIAMERPGEPQAKLAELLGVTAIKDQVESIIRKVLPEREGDPNTDPDKEPKRGKQRWHEVIQFVKSKPENYRPWANMPEQTPLG